MGNVDSLIGGPRVASCDFRENCQQLLYISCLLDVVFLSWLRCRQYDSITRGQKLTTFKKSPTPDDVTLDTYMTRAPSVDDFKSFKSVFIDNHL